MSNWAEYKNGNYTVKINLSSGSKIRYNDLDNLTPSTIESMDLKITNCCDMGCRYCHEDSKPDGKHAKLFGHKFLETLHPYTEIAIGGGNPLSHPNLDWFLELGKRRKWIPSITINQVHFEKDFERIRKLAEDKLIYGIGISLIDPTDKFIEMAKIVPNTVIHVIGGIVTKEELIKLSHNNLKLLLLGYKNFRRGKNNYDDEKDEVIRKKRELYDLLPKMMEEKWFEVISFDNLALEQFEPKRLLSSEEWERYYMGDDGQYTLYVDLVNEMFAKNSCEPLEKRYAIMDSIEDMLGYIQKKGASI